MCASAFRKMQATDLREKPGSELWTKRGQHFGRSEGPGWLTMPIIILNTKRDQLRRKNLCVLLLFFRSDREFSPGTHTIFRLRKSGLCEMLIYINKQTVNPGLLFCCIGRIYEFRSFSSDQIGSFGLKRMLSSDVLCLPADALCLPADVLLSVCKITKIDMFLKRYRMQFKKTGWLFSALRFIIFSVWT